MSIPRKVREEAAMIDEPALPQHSPLRFKVGDRVALSDFGREHFAWRLSRANAASLRLERGGVVVSVGYAFIHVRLDGNRTALAYSPRLWAVAS
jgi:hypothetical protein